MTTSAADPAAEEPGAGSPALASSSPPDRPAGAAAPDAASPGEGGSAASDEGGSAALSERGSVAQGASTASSEGGSAALSERGSAAQGGSTASSEGGSAAQGASTASSESGSSALGEGGEEKPRRARGEQTRQLILETALRLFRERGYTETTMRAVAKEAGVAVGNAYYYFDSKEHLIQGFYDRNQAAHRAAVEVVFAKDKDFAARLRGALHAGIDVNQPYHSFAATFFKTAAEPSSPLSPFSRESSPAREAAIAIFRDVVDGSSAKLDPELRKELPELLWLGWMGVVLFWVYDHSPDQRRTRRLIDGVVPLVDRLVGLSRLRVLRPALRQILALLESIRRED